MSKKLRRQKRIGKINCIKCNLLQIPDGILSIENGLSKDELELFRCNWNSSVNNQDISKIIPIKHGKRYYHSGIKAAKRYAYKYNRKFGFKKHSKNKIGYTSKG